MAKVMLWGPVPWTRTGYGKNLLGLGLRLAEAGHEVSQLAWGVLWGKTEYPIWRCRCGRIVPGVVREPETCTCKHPSWRCHVITVYPNDADDYGQDWFPKWHHFVRPDITIFHFDAWPLGPFKGFPHPLAVYSPVDHEPLPPPVRAALEGEDRVIAMTRFAERQYQEAGIKPYAYIPHAVDTGVYRPGSMAAARRRLKLPEDCFLVSCVGTNRGPRKNLGNLLRSFRDFLDQEPSAREDAFLFLVTDVYPSKANPQAYNLPQLWSTLGIAERIKYPHSVYYRAYGFTEEEMADTFRASNFSVLVSLGEGFGLPLAESLACGAPVIFSDVAAAHEVVGPGGLPVEAKERFPFELSSSFQWIPSQEQTAARLVEAYRDWKQGGGLREELGKKGRRHVLANYTWGKVMPKWLDLVEGALPGGIPQEVILPARDPRVEGEVDIIVITWQGLALNGLLSTCIEALYENTTTPFHLVVVDDQSTDSTREFMEDLWREKGNITYVKPRAKCNGGSQVMNIGYRHTRNDLIVSMNNDVTVRPGWLEEAVRCMRSDPAIGVVGMKMLYEDGRIQHGGGTFIRDIYPAHLGLGEPEDSHSGVEPVLWVSGPCVLVRRECLEPGWDEDFDTFGGHEDIDLCLTARSQGWRVMYCGKAVVYHAEGQTVTRFPNFQDMHARARQVFFEKWVGSIWLRHDSLGKEGR